MADVAKRLVGPMQPTASSAVYYTVPASTTCILRSIHVANTSGAAAYSFSMSINGSASAVANQIFSNMAVPASGAVDWSGFLVMSAGETITLLAATAATVTVVVCGVEVS